MKGESPDWPLDSLQMRSGSPELAFLIRMVTRVEELARAVVLTGFRQGTNARIESGCERRSIDTNSRGLPSGGQPPRSW
jgi:hypothetical protein